MGIFNTKKVLTEEAKTNPGFIVLHKYIERSTGEKRRPCYLNTNHISFALKGTYETGCVMTDGTLISVIPEDFDDIVKKLGKRGVKCICEREGNYGEYFTLEAVINIDCFLYLDLNREDFRMLGQRPEEVFKFNIEEIKQAVEQTKDKAQEQQEG